MPAIATVEDVRNLDIREDLSQVHDGYIQCVLDDEAACIIGDIWGSLRRRGEALVAAHIVSRELQGSNGPAGPVVSESAGGLSRSYASPGGLSRSDSDWGSTPYGQRYLRLRATLPTSPIALGAC